MQTAKPLWTQAANPANLLPAELDALNHLELACESFLVLPHLNSHDRADFLHHIHDAQRIILSRPALRATNTTRPIHRYDCKTCFGWGVYIGPFHRDSCIPITAHQAHTKEFLWATSPCPECGSGPEGAPKAVTESIPASLMLDSNYDPVFKATCPDCGHCMLLVENWPETCNCTKWILRLTATRVGQKEAHIPCNNESP